MGILADILILLIKLIALPFKALYYALIALYGMGIIMAVVFIITVISML
tara:strand:+ start:6941 stop:7087 length:147 start_codon:yes stop_codon:yes gene_type:complete